MVALLDTSLLNSLEALPVDLRDMEQTILARHDLYEAAVRHDAANHTIVNLTYLGDSHDSLDLSQGCVDALLIGTRYLYLTNTVGFVDSDSGLGVFLHLLDNLTARADDSTDELLRNLDLDDTGNLRLELGTGLSDSIGETLQDVLTTSLCLHQSLLEDVEAQTVALDIHLGSCQTVLCTGGLEVHITQVVLVTENIAQYSVLVFSRILDQTHGDTRNGLLHGHTSVHQGEGTGTNGSH